MHGREKFLTWRWMIRWNLDVMRMMKEKRENGDEISEMHEKVNFVEKDDGSYDMYQKKCCRLAITLQTKFLTSSSVLMPTMKSEMGWMFHIALSSGSFDRTHGYWSLLDYLGERESQVGHPQKRYSATHGKYLVLMVERLIWNILWYADVCVGEWFRANPY